jgi:hypothetical protein
VIDDDFKTKKKRKGQTFRPAADSRGGAGKASSSAKKPKTIQE